MTARVRELEAELKAWLLVAQAEANLPSGSLAAQRERDDALALLSELRSRQSRLEVDSRLSGDWVALFSPAERAKSDGVPTIAALAIGIVLGALVGAGLAYWRDARTQAFSSRYGPSGSPRRSCARGDTRLQASGARLEAARSRGAGNGVGRGLQIPRVAHRHLGRPEVERASGRTRTGLAAALPGAERPRAGGTEPRRERRSYLRSRSQGLRPQPRDGRSHAPRDPRQAGKRSIPGSRDKRNHRRGRARVESAERGQEPGARKRRRRPSLRRLRRRVVPRRYDDAPRQHGPGSRTGGQSGARDRRRRGQARLAPLLLGADDAKSTNGRDDPSKGLTDLLLHGSSAESIVPVMETSAGGTLSLLAPGTAAMGCGRRLPYRPDRGGVRVGSRPVRPCGHRPAADPRSRLCRCPAAERRGSRAGRPPSEWGREPEARPRPARPPRDPTRSGTCTTSRRCAGASPRGRPLARLASKNSGERSGNGDDSRSLISPGRSRRGLRRFPALGGGSRCSRRRWQAAEPSGCAEARRRPRSAGLRGRPRPRGRRRASPGGDSTGGTGRRPARPARPDLPSRALSATCGASSLVPSPRCSITRTSSRSGRGSSPAIRDVSWSSSRTRSPRRRGTEKAGATG